MENKEDKCLFRKPSIRKKQPLPPVRETLTSRIRLLKADPLLAKELGIQDLNKLTSIKSSKDGNLLDHKLKSYINQFGDKKSTTPVQHTSNDSRQQESDASSRKLQSIHVEKSMVINNNGKNDKKSNVDKGKKHVSSSNTSMFHHSQQLLSSTRLPATKTKKVDYIKQNIEQASKKTKIKDLQQQKTNPPKDPTVKTVKQKPIRRSLSAQHIDRKNGKRINDKPEECFKRIDKAQSFEEIRNMEKKRMAAPPQISPVVEEHNLTFKTPSAYQRRSVINNKTPATMNIKNNRNTTLFGFTSTPAPYNLQKRLAEWLEKRGRTMNDFQHLKCFGIDRDLQQNQQINDDDDENKENIEIVINDEIDENLENISKEILIDLQNLLTDGYPVEQCEIWLHLIEQKYNKLHKEPDYWELRALIEQSRGNITTAVECYQNAIIQGAEIRSVDESLENLLQKFSLLNITPTKQINSNHERQRIIKDARNVFKSSIIQFAVKERTLKNRNNDNNNIDNVNKKFVITPVRRSTRLSRATKYTSTPGTKIYSSIKDVESPIRRNFDFQDNPAL